MGFDWEEFAQLTITGIATGSVFSLLALAIVLIFRSTGILNFAQGEIALFTTYICWSLMTTMPFWPAFMLVILIAFFIGAILERFVMRPVEQAPVLNSVIVTLGLFTLFNGLTLYIWGAAPKGFGPFSIFEGEPFCAGEVCLGRLNLGVIVVSFIVMAVLYVLFQHTRLGLAMRATAENRLASQLVGIPVGNMLTIGWALSAAVGAVGGVMVAQSTGLTTFSLFFILLYAFAAAVLGGLDSPPGAIIGGIVLGCALNYAGAYVPSEIGSVDLIVAFAMIVIVLMVRPQGLLGRPPARRV
jgi:branched-chain amino acid transport system permease protein